MRHITFLCLAFALALSTAACGGATPGAVDAGSDASTGLDAGSDRDAALEDAGTEADAASADDAASPSDAGCMRPDAAMGSNDVMCNAAPPVFPSFDRSCCADSDCVVVRHQIDCCGSFIQTGLSAGGEEAFATAEATCESQYPRCRCLARPDVANDETMASGSADVATVRCMDHACVTTFSL